MSEEEKKEEKVEEEKVEEHNFKTMNLVDRRRAWETLLNEISPMAAEHLQSGPTVNLTDTERVSRFSHFIADWPIIKQEAHWQLQTFLLIEILEVMRDIRSGSKGTTQKIKKI